MCFKNDESVTLCDQTSWQDVERRIHYITSANYSIELRGGYQIKEHTLLPKITISLRQYSYKGDTRVDSEESVNWIVLDSEKGCESTEQATQLIHDYMVACNFHRNRALQLWKLIERKDISKLQNDEEIQRWLNFNLRP